MAHLIAGVFGLALAAARAPYHHSMHWSSGPSVPGTTTLVTLILPDFSRVLHEQIFRGRQGERAFWRSAANRQAYRGRLRAGSVATGLAATVVLFSQHSSHRRVFALTFDVDSISTSTSGDESREETTYFGDGCCGCHCGLQPVRTD